MGAPWNVGMLRQRGWMKNFQGLKCLVGKALFSFSALIDKAMPPFTGQIPHLFHPLLPRDAQLGIQNRMEPLSRCISLSRVLSG